MTGGEVYASFRTRRYNVDNITSFPAERILMAGLHERIRWHWLRLKIYEWVSRMCIGVPMISIRC